jgi:hypothetical protein
VSASLILELSKETLKPMGKQLPHPLQVEIDSALTELRASLNGISLDMHLRNIGGAVTNILGMVQVTPEIETAADNARDQAVAFAHFIERRKPFLSEEEKADAARELKDAEQTFHDFAAALANARPSTKASILGIGW